MTEPAAGALAAFRAFNFERIYLRPGRAPAGREGRRPARAASSTSSSTRRRACPSMRDRRCAPASFAGSPEAAAVAVRYVSGMTDRYALGLGVELLGWRPEHLPRGV